LLQILYYKEKQVKVIKLSSVNLFNPSFIQQIWIISSMPVPVLPSKVQILKGHGSCF